MAVSARMAASLPSPLRGGSTAAALQQDSAAPTRPIRLFARPEPIEAIAEVPDGPPVQFTWRRMRHVVSHAEGPERIAMEWWRDEENRALTRDYFRVESREGVRVWLYREGLIRLQATHALVSARRVRMRNVVRLPDKEKKGQTFVLPAPDPSHAYAELAVTTNFSFLRGASHPKELILQALAVGLTGIGIADRNSVAGVVRAYSALEEWNEHVRDEKEKTGIDLPTVKLVVGARLCFADDTPDILAYPQNRTAWGRLTRLLTVGKSRGEKAECILYLDDLIEHIAGLNLIVMPPVRIKADSLGTILTKLRSDAARRSVWLAASMLYRGDDNRRLARLKAVAEKSFVPLIAVNDVLYHVPERRPLQDVMTCIREHVTIDKAGRLLEANAERHLKSPQEMARCSAVRRRQSIARCAFSIAAISRSRSWRRPNIRTRTARALQTRRMRSWRLSKLDTGNAIPMEPDRTFATRSIRS